jgi:hypothetical protein
MPYLQKIGHISMSFHPDDIEFPNLKRVWDRIEEIHNEISRTRKEIETTRLVKSQTRNLAIHFYRLAKAQNFEKGKVEDLHMVITDYRAYCFQIKIRENHVRLLLKYGQNLNKLLRTVLSRESYITGISESELRRELFIRRKEELIRKDLAPYEEGLRGWLFGQLTREFQRVPPTRAEREARLRVRLFNELTSLE